MQEAITIQRFQDSQARAIATHGQDFVNEVTSWAADLNTLDPTFGAKIFAQPDPAAWVIAEKQRADMLKSFETDPDAYVRNRAIEMGLANVTTTAATQPMASKPTGPKSLANAKSRDNVTAETPADAFDAIFRK